MRPTALLRSLPPLPPRNTWPTAFPRPSYALVSLLNSRMTPNRVTLASTSICDRFVQELELKPDDVVLEAYSGPGVLTRSLLGGGLKKVVAIEPGPELIKHPHGLAIDPETLKEVEEAQHVSKKKKNTKAAKDVKGKGRKAEAAALDELEALEAAEAAEEAMEEMDDESDDDPVWSPTARTAALSPVMEEEKPRTLKAATLLSSSHDSKLSVLPYSPYDWDTWASLLLHPLFTGENAIVKPMDWESNVPALRFVAQIPDSMTGEQLISQWIACIPRRNWLFAYGRVRMDLLVSPSLFDRMIAQPDSRANCKLSIMTSALCDIKILPPYHMDPSQTTRITNRLIRKDYRHSIDSPAPAATARRPPQSRAAREAVDQSNRLTGYPFELHEATPTVTADFHPQKAMATSVPLDRPALIGISVTPKIESVINPTNKDHWDYVLRNLFVSNSKPLRAGISLLGPGASNLLKVIRDPPKDWGPDVVGVEENRMPRSFTVKEWTTVVLAFENWAFQPENLTLVEAAEDQVVRAIGTGM